MEHHLLADMGISIVGASVLGFVAHHLKFPLILAYLLAGVILGPHLGFAIVKNPQSISTVSEIGLVLLMFILGLEIDIRKLLLAGKAVLINGVTQFVGCAILATGFFSFLGFAENSYQLTYLAIACSLSSTLVVIKILSDQMDLDALPSRITIGILVIQDIWAIAFLAIQPNLANLGFAALGISLLKVGILVTSSWMLARFVLPHIFSKVGRQPELLLIIAMAWCFAMCGLANFLSVSLEMGALIAGVSIASFPYKLDVAAKISSLRDFFITLFFVGLGLRIPMPSSSVFALSAFILIFVMFSRLITIFPVLYFLGYGNRASFLPAINLSQLSEFSIVLASLGLTYGHIGSELLSAFIIAMVAGALLSSFFIPKSHLIYKLINPVLLKIGFIDRITSDHDSSNKHRYPQIVLLGFYREGSSLLFEMQKRFSQEVINDTFVVDYNPEAHQLLKKMNLNCQYGDISSIDTLSHLNLQQAKLIICTIPDLVLKGTTNLKLLIKLKKLSPQAKIIMTAERIELAKEMYSLGADYVFLPRMVGAEHLIEVIERIQTERAHELKSDALQELKTRQEVIP